MNTFLGLGELTAIELGMRELLSGPTDEDDKKRTPEEWKSGAAVNQAELLCLAKIARRS